MALTDREIIKEREAGVAQSYPLAGTAKAAVAAKHTRTYVANRNFATAAGLENAETSVSEVALFSVLRPGVVRFAKIVNQTTVAENATDAAYITLGKSTAGAASVVIASWNTGASGGALTKWVPTSMTVSPNADAILAAGDVVTYTKVAASTGGIVDGAIVIDIEEV